MKKIYNKFNVNIYIYLLRCLLPTIFILSLSSCLCKKDYSNYNYSLNENKIIIGNADKFLITEAKLSFRGRVDTGAKTVSINASDISVKNESPNYIQNINKPIQFTITNEKGEKKRIKTTIAAVDKVRSSLGEEIRYYVLLTIRWKNFSKKVLVNLKNRRNMKYKLLIGRIWLRDDFIVDPSIGDPDSKVGLSID